jgi:hypothetical protein
MKRIRADHEWFELRGAEVRKKRGPSVVDCDVHGCMAQHPAAPNMIFPGNTYARISTGLNVCHLHFEPSDVVEAP